MARQPGQVQDEHLSCGSYDCYTMYDTLTRVVKLTHSETTQKVILAARPHSEPYRASCSDSGERGIGRMETEDCSGKGERKSGRGRGRGIQ